jgi:molybdopterin synthase sulfur carrier subunit
MAKLLFLGRLEDIAGMAEMEVSEGPLVEVLADLDKTLAMALTGDRIRIAHNGVLVSECGSITLCQGDEVAFLPPVSGG